MWRVLCLLSVLTVPLEASHQARRDIRRLYDTASHGIFERIPYSSSVPIWQYSPASDFICERPGYFPDPLHCQYFYKCTAFIPGHLFRFIYRCDQDRVYSPETHSCVLTVESDRACGAWAEEPEDQSSVEDQGEQMESEETDLGGGGYDAVEKQPSKDDLTNENEKKQTTTAQSLTVQDNGSAPNAPTEETVLLITTKEHSPESIVIPNVEVHVTVEEDQDLHPVEDTLPLSSESQKVPTNNQSPWSPETEHVPAKVPVISEREEVHTQVPSISEREEVHTQLPAISEKEVVHTQAPPISEREELRTKLPSASEEEKVQNHTTATSVQSVEEEPTTTISTTLPSSEPKQPTNNTQEIAENTGSRVCYDEKDNSDCVDEGFYGVPEDCSKFYRCVSFGFRFIKYELLCPLGTIWDDGLKTCNFRTAVKQITCKDKYLPVTPTPPASPASSDTACPLGNSTEDRIDIVCPTGFRQHPKYCNMFYQCTSSDNLDVNFMSFVCPEEMVFDMERLRCSKDEARSQSCAIFRPRGRLDSNRILSVWNTELCPEEGRFPYGESCSSRYIECQRDEHGVLEGFLYKCPRGQLYSMIKDQCMSFSLFPYCSRDSLK